MHNTQDVTTKLVPDVILHGSLLSEPIKVIAAPPLGTFYKIIGQGLKTNQVHQPILTREQIALLTATPEKEPFDGDARRFRLEVKALCLGLIYEYDPLFSLSIARVDPLPHQLEAIYAYFLKLPWIRFLLADASGAGKTIMTGLLIKELKIRGLIQYILIVMPANLTFQWQREMKDRFCVSFEIMRDEEIERIAIQEAIAHEEAHGWRVESVGRENRRFDLISPLPDQEDPQSAIDVRFIEVEGRAEVDLVALSLHEYKTVERLKQNHWLYVVFNCASSPELLHAYQVPVRMNWEPLVKVEHYCISAHDITGYERGQA